MLFVVRTFLLIQSRHLPWPFHILLLLPSYLIFAVEFPPSLVMAAYRQTRILVLSQSTKN